MSLQKTIKNRWDKRGNTGKNFQTVAKALKGKDQAGLTKFFNRIHGYMDDAGIKTGQTLDVRVASCLPTSEDKEYKCQNCGKKGLKHATRLTYHVNDTPLLPKDVGESFGNECFSIVTYVAEAGKRADFEMPKKDERARQENIERYSKVTLTADQLDKKAVRKLRQAGIDPSRTRIPADKADNIQKAIARGDLSVLDGIKGCSDLVGWGIREFNNITDENVKYTAALFKTKQFSRVTPEQWNEFKLYAWQYRKVGAAEEISDLKDDIEYWMEISKNTPEHLDKLVKKYETIDLKKQLIPIKLFDKAEWEDLTLETLLYNRQEITKAQSRALRRTIPGLERRRIEHNRKTIEQYCGTNEFKTILENLETKYAEVKSAFAAAYTAGVKEPDNAWKHSYKRLKKAFFETKEKVEQTGDTISLREIVLKYTPMRKADETARTLYIEGKKLELAKRLGEEILRREYLVLNSNEKLDKLLNGALELDKPTREGRRRIEKTGMSKGTIRKLIEDAKESAQHGIIQTKYVQPEKDRYTKAEIPSMLERALELTADYEKDDTTQQQINRFKLLENELGVKIVDVRASDGRAATRKSDPRLKLQTFDGKTYYSPEQRKAIDNLFKSSLIPEKLRTGNVAELKKTIETVQKYHTENKTYTNNLSHLRYGGGNPESAQFLRVEMPTPRKYAVTQPNIDWYVQEAGKISKGEYQPITPETRRKLQVLTQKQKRDYISVGLKDETLDTILADEKSLLSQDLVKAIDKKYEEYVQQARGVRVNNRRLRGLGYDVDELIKRLQKIKRKHPEFKIIEKYGAYTYATPVQEALSTLQRNSQHGKEYIKKLYESTKSAHFVLTQGKEMYENAQNSRFDFVATCDLKDADKNEHRLKAAFGPKRNDKKALMLCNTRGEEKVGNEILPQYTWFGTNRQRDDFDKICARAEKMGNIYIRIMDARQ